MLTCVRRRNGVEDADIFSVGFRDIRHTAHYMEDALRGIGGATEVSSRPLAHAAECWLLRCRHFPIVPVRSDPSCATHIQAILLRSIDIANSFSLIFQKCSHSHFCDRQDWYNRYRVKLWEGICHQEHEMLDCPAAVLVVVSSTEVKNVDAESTEVEYCTGFWRILFVRDICRVRPDLTV